MRHAECIENTTVVEDQREDEKHDACLDKGSYQHCPDMLEPEMAYFVGEDREELFFRKI